MNRGTGGKFTAKGDESREVRSFRLTDTTYKAITDTATRLNISKGDYLEKLNGDGVFTDSGDETYTEKVRELFDAVLLGLLSDLYNDNELGIGSKDKAPVKRYLEKLIDNLDKVIEKYQ